MNKQIEIVDGIYLTPNGHTDEARFAKVFTETWRRIPERFRRPILAHWQFGKAERPTWSQLEQVPTIEVLPFWPGKWPVEPDAFTPADFPKISGQVLADGAIVRFHAATVDVLPDEILASLIAHELSHVYQCAEGLESCFGTPEPGAADLEEHADQMMHSWGFDAEQPDRWMPENGYNS